MFSNEFLLLAGELLRINRCAVFNRHVGRDDTRKMILKDAEEWLMQTGMIGQPVFVAILKDPSWNGSSSVSEAFLFRVPSGKIMMEMPDLT